MCNICYRSDCEWMGGRCITSPVGAPQNSNHHRCCEWECGLTLKIVSEVTGNRSQLYKNNSWSHRCAPPPRHHLTGPLLPLPLRWARGSSCIPCLTRTSPSRPPSQRWTGYCAGSKTTSGASSYSARPCSRSAGQAARGRPCPHPCSSARRGLGTGS